LCVDLEEEELVHHRVLSLALASSGVGIPDYLSLMRPILEVLSDGSERTSADLRRAMAEHFALSDDELA
jgi:hypothetical protein